MSEQHRLAADRLTSPTRLTAVPDTLLPDEDRGPRWRRAALWVAGVLALLAMIGGVVYLAVGGNTVTDQRDAAVGQSVGLAQQVQQACTAGQIPADDRLCRRADEVQAEPIPGSAGAQGVPGIAGAPGGTGSPGPGGSVGPSGATGAQGIPGVDGAPGVPGPAGAEGQPGAAGATGAEGAQAAPGRDAPRPRSARFERDGSGCVYVTEYDDGTELRAPAGDAACPLAMPSSMSTATGSPAWDFLLGLFA